jgi:hypothetical protein
MSAPVRPRGRIPLVRRPRALTYGYRSAAGWRFLESDADGKIWLERPDKTFAFIEEESVRIMVATKTWAGAAFG